MREFECGEPLSWIGDTEEEKQLKEKFDEIVSATCNMEYNQKDNMFQEVFKEVCKVGLRVIKDFGDLKFYNTLTAKPEDYLQLCYSLTKRLYTEVEETAADTKLVEYYINKTKTERIIL